MPIEPWLRTAGRDVPNNVSERLSCAEHGLLDRQVSRTLLLDGIGDDACFSVPALPIDRRFSFACTEAREEGIGTGRPAALAAATNGSCSE